jgi:hypothetical protein
LIEAGYPAPEVMSAALGYNVTVYPSICHSLQRTTPKTTDRVCEKVTDYLGNSMDVDLSEAVALYPIGRTLGDTMQKANYENIEYLRNYYGREVDERERFVYLDGHNRPTISISDGVSDVPIMQGAPVEISEDGTYEGR